MNDASLGELLQAHEHDPQVLAVVLTGSRAAGVADAESDTDLLLVLTEDAYQHRSASGAPLQVKGDGLDLVYSSLGDLRTLASSPDWRSPGFLGARPLLDRTDGELQGLLESIVHLSPEKAQADAPGWLDAYLNAFYRSLKALRRGNLLGGHLEAAESVPHLVRSLFALHGLITPYWDRLTPEWPRLTRAPWRGSELPDRLHHILSTADPTAQQTLEREVETLYRREGHRTVFDAWGEELVRVKSLRF
ncbi:MAG TPA: nucleotidyltransferase domain-containing protein [Armatimonadota bacterium]|jgi:hypothetical protein